jgi:ATP-binding cassette, subfamily B, bacterial
LREALIGIGGWRSMEVPIETGRAVSIALAALLFLDGSLSLGSVYVVVSYGSMLFEPVENLMRQIGNLQRAVASARRVQALFAERSSLNAPVQTPRALPAGPLAVELQDVTFAYPGDDPVLRAISLVLPAGQTLGVIGRTGSGKTTLTRLLLRLYDVNAGAVRIGGVDARQTTNDDLRARTAVVTQDVQLFNASVRDNLTLFDATIGDVRVREAVAEVGMQDWLDALSEGLDTRLSGSGGLSAGEAQLLAFARAFLRDPGLVMLDEASSRLDPATERKLDAAVDLLLRNRTGVIVAHRLSTLDRVDSILILEDGCVREFGPRAVLAADPASRYSQLLAAGIEEALA